MRRRNPLRPVLVALLATLSLLALVDRASAQAVVSDPLPGFDAPHEAVPPAGVDRAAASERARVRAELASARRRHLGMLRRYARAMAFPVNGYRPGMTNVFVDGDGHLCAAANLIARDGHRDLVDVTAAQDNFVRLVEVEGGPLLEWMLRSGFTQEEIGRIQEPYAYLEREAPSYRRELEDEKRRVRGVLLEVARQLERETDAGLELATDGLLAHLAANGARS